MEIRNLITFLKAAEEGSFSRTAANLGYAQSTVTMQIKQLEEEMGVRLFDRIGKKVLLTAKGEELKGIASVIVREAARAVEMGRSSTQPAGALRIGVTPSVQNYFLPDLLHYCLQENPMTSITVQTGTAEVLSDRLNHNDLDLLFLCGKRMRSTPLVTVWERQEPVHFISSAFHPLQKKEALTAKQIMAYPFFQSHSDGECGTVLSEYLESQGIVPDFRIDVNDARVILKLVARNDGISCLPDYVTQTFIESKQVAYLSGASAPFSVWLQLLYHRNKYMTASMYSFIQLFLAHMGTSASIAKPTPSSLSTDFHG